MACNSLNPSYAQRTTSWVPQADGLEFIESILDGTSTPRPVAQAAAPVILYGRALARQGPVRVALEQCHYVLSLKRLFIQDTCEKQPFRDNAHRDRDTNRRSYKFEVLQPVSVYVCLCKRTMNPPFCDDACGMPQHEPVE